MKQRITSKKETAATSGINMKAMTLCPLFAALLAVCSQIQIPLPYVPLNLALFAVYMTAAVLGPRYGTLSVTVYILLGISGIPVFAGYGAGLAKITGMTGGYIVGYILAAFIGGSLIKLLGFRWYVLAPSFAAGLIACYALGTAWFMYVSGNGLAASLSICVFPFLAADAVKIALATVLALRIRKVIKIY